MFRTEPGFLFHELLQAWHETGHSTQPQNLRFLETPMNFQIMFKGIIKTWAEFWPDICTKKIWIFRKKWWMLYILVSQWVLQRSLMEWGAVVWWAYSSCISLTASRVEGLNPGLSLSFIHFQIREEAFFTRRNVSAWKVARNEESGEHGSGESKRKNRQAFQEWLQERLLVRFEDD